MIFVLQDRYESPLSIDTKNTGSLIQVHSSNILVLEAKGNYREVATTPSTPNFDSLPYPLEFSVLLLTGK